MNDLINCSIYMFNKIFDQRILIEPQFLLNFLFTVRRSYRNTTYHNFEHAFNVLHSVYCILIRNTEMFTFIERVALVIGAVCHDLDHRGFTSNFLQTNGSPLVTLYHESPLENHHFWVTKIILDSTNLLRSVNQSDQKAIMTCIKKLILATDLTQHLKNRSKVRDICDDNSLDWKNDGHRELITNILMTSADLSGQAKRFDVAQRLVNNVLSEFYQEGDLQKKMGIIPMAVMDREQTNNIPDYQVQFLNRICVPCYELLGLILPNTIEIYNLCQ